MVLGLLDLLGQVVGSEMSMSEGGGQRKRQVQVCADADL